jgi:hypothetical protein
MNARFQRAFFIIEKFDRIWRGGVCIPHYPEKNTPLYIPWENHISTSER